MSLTLRFPSDATQRSELDALSMNEDRKIAVSWKAPGMVVQLPCGCGHPLADSPPCTDPVGDAAHRSLADEASRNWIWTRHLMLRACLWAAQGNDKAFSSTTDEVRAMLEAQGLLPGGTVTLCAHEGTDPLHTLSRIEPEYRQALWQFTYVHVLATTVASIPLAHPPPTAGYRVQQQRGACCRLQLGRAARDWRKSTLP